MTLRSYLTKVQKELKKKEEVKDELRKDMRRATRTSKQSILYVHQERFEDAEELLQQVKELFMKLQKISKDYPDLKYAGSVDAAYQEYAEACIFLNLIKKNSFPDPLNLKIPLIQYVLGLGDVVGELRRRALDLMRKGRVKPAEQCLELMEHIYIELTAMDDAYLLVSGLRRKCDIARHVIEATRGDVTNEVRRSLLENHLERLIESLKKV